MLNITAQDYDTLTKLRWLQLNELAIKYSTDQEFGMDYDQLGHNEQEWVIDYIDICLS